MNFGLVIRRALQRTELPFDEDHLDLARGFANDNIQDVWYKVKSDYRIQRDKTLSMVSGTNEYALDKLCDGIVKNSFQGSAATPRVMSYQAVESFNRKTARGLDVTGYPFIYTLGELRGFDSQLSTASVIKVASTLANVTSGTLGVTAGSKRVTSSGSVFTKEHEGLRIEITGDGRTYKIAKYKSTSEVELDEKYRGVTNSTAGYKLGDIGQEVTIEGVVSTQVDTEVVVLDGTTTQTTTKSFSSVRGVTKTDLTGGRVTAKNNAEDETVATLAPDEFEIERQTVLVWPTPAQAETLTYDQYAKHPVLRQNSDRLLLPERFHKFIQYLTTADLLGWDEKSIPELLSSKITKGWQMVEDDAEDTSQQATIPRDEGSTGWGDQYYYDHDEDFG